MHFDGKFVRISVYKITCAVYNKTQEKTAPLSRSREFGKAFGTVSEKGVSGLDCPFGFAASRLFGAVSRFLFSDGRGTDEAGEKSGNHG